MNRIIKNTDDTIVISVYAWWFFALDSIKGPVLMVGNFGKQTIDYISDFTDQLHILDLGDHEYLQSENYNLVKLPELSNMKFNAILVNALNPDVKIDNNVINVLINDCMDDEHGKFCFIEKNTSYLKDHRAGYFYKFISIFNDFRLKELSLLCENKSLIKLPSISYDKFNPYESFSECLYSSNKNTFNLKERVRNWILKSRLSRIFVNSNMWLVSGSKSSGFLHDNLLKLVCEEKQLACKDYFFSRVLFKNGKLILTFKHRLDLSKSFVAMLLYDDKSVSQRNNEYAIIKHLSQFEELNELLPQNYSILKYLGFNVVVMDECQGVTVDLKSKNLNEMTLDAFDKLIRLSNMTRAEFSLKSSVLSWFEVVKSRAPDCNDDFKVISKVLDKFNTNLSVCMHGDSKLENFVLDNNFKVKSIIDWEQAIVNGVPLIDVYYLIAYNYQTINGCQFSRAYQYLSQNEINQTEKGMVDRYCQEIGLSNDDKQMLLIVFFIHHYSCRFHAATDDAYEYSDFKKSLSNVIKLIEGAE